MGSILIPIGFCLAVYACGVVTGWALHLDRHRKPQRRPMTLFHVEATHGLGYTVESIDEARDLADWLDENGQLKAFWYEQIDAEAARKGDAMDDRDFQVLKAGLAADVARITGDIRKTKDKWHGRKSGPLANLTKEQREQMYALSRELEKVLDEIR